MEVFGRPAPFDRPVISPAQKICPAWRKNVSCGDMELEEISRSVEDFRKTAKCSGCVDNLAAMLCGAFCSPVLLSAGNTLEISPVFCAATQLSCDGVPQCTSSSPFAAVLREMTKNEIRFKSVDQPADEILPMSAECAPLSALPLSAPPGHGLQFIFLVCVCVAVWFFAKIRGRKRKEVDNWATLDLSAGDSRRL